MVTPSGASAASAGPAVDLVDRLYFEIGVSGFRAHAARIRDGALDKKRLDTEGEIGFEARELPDILTREFAVGGTRHVVFIITADSLYSNGAKVAELLRGRAKQAERVQVTFVIVGADLSGPSKMRGFFLGLNQLGRTTVRVSANNAYPVITAD